MMEASRLQFVEWWLMTEFGSKKELQQAIKWDSKQHRSDIWSSFDQVANARTGEPKVMCRHCQNVVVHPRFNRSGPSPMKNHLNSTYCTKPQKTTKLGIDQLLREMVSLFWILFISYTNILSLYIATPAEEQGLQPDHFPAEDPKVYHN
jgi:hypothetical protein